ncbi:MAG: hypothetical protein ACP6IP_09570 [Candidatus Njordarchaeia archaeon]
MSTNTVSEKERSIRKSNFGDIEREIERILGLLNFRKLQIFQYRGDLFALTLKRNLIMELEKKFDKSLSDTYRRELIYKLEDLDNTRLQALLSAILIAEVYLDTTDLKDSIETVCLSLYKDNELSSLDTLYIKVKLKSGISLKDSWPIWRELRRKIDSKIGELFGEEGRSFMGGIRLVFER